VTLSKYNELSCVNAGGRKGGRKSYRSFLPPRESNVHNDLLETATVLCFQIERSDKWWLYKVTRGEVGVMTGCIWVRQVLEGPSIHSCLA
jgi:hypothetical protein